MGVAGLGVSGRVAELSRKRIWAMKIACYDTDLTDAQWHLIRPHLP